MTFGPPGFEDELDSRMARLLFGLLWLCVVVGVLYLLGTPLVVHRPMPSGYPWVAVVGMVVALALLYRRQLAAASLVAALSVVAGVSLEAAAVGAPSTYLPLLPLYCLALGFGAVQRWQILVTLIVVEFVAAIALLWAERAGMLPPMQPHVAGRMTVFTAGFIVVIGGFTLAVSTAYSQTFNRVKRQTRALTQSEERFRGLVEALADGVLTLDPSGVVLSANPAACAIIGRSHDQLVGAGFTDVIRPADVTYDPPGVKSLLGMRKGHELQRITLDRPDGAQVIIEPNPSVVGSGGDQQVLVVIRDVTARVQVERERQALEQQLRDARRLEAVGRLAGGVAHDFNNMLTVIMSSTEMLRVDPLEREVDELVTNIESAAKSAANLTGSLLAFARRQVRAPRPLDLNSVLAQLAGLFPNLVREDIELRIDTSDEELIVFADPAQLEQVVVNLVVNARDAMTDGGKLTIETARVELDDDYAERHAGVQPGLFGMLAVTDTGAGMDEETKGHIFDPFFSTKGEAGTGLGLATVHGVVKQSGGHVFVYSEIGVGTTFKIYLPLSREGVRPDQVDDARSSGATISGTVLVVDDEVGVRDIACRILREAGLRVLSAADPEEALATSQSHRGAIHLLLTDVVLPKFSGRELAERIQLGRPSVRVLYTSGYTENAIVKRGVLDDGIDFLPKPFTPSKLREAVARVLREPA